MLGDLDPVSHRFEQRALGQVVVAEEDRIDIRVAGDHLQEQFAAQADRGRAGRQHFQRRVIQAGLLQGFAETFAAQQGALVQLRADVGQAFATAGQQVFGRRFAGRQLREAHAIEPGGAVQLHHVHAGNVAGFDHPPRAFGAVEPGQQQAAWLIGHVVAQQVFFFIA
ncbi:hypothetical protein D3C78_1250780 [compost metagenome]